VGTLLVVLVAAAALAAAYVLFLRPWHVAWGASEEEQVRSMPGDDLVDRPLLGATRAVTVAAAPAEVWPWIVQIGQGRGGFYSYTWLENGLLRLGIRNADRIHPEWQELRPGDVVRLAPEGRAPPPIPVQVVEPGRFLVLGARSPDLSTSWCFGLYPAPDGGTRLVFRTRDRWRLGPGGLVWLVLSDVGSFFMVRRMLLGIRERVERAGRDRPSIRPA
jgi:hypothetical protein